MKAIPVLEAFDPTVFLDRFWARSPCLIRGWLEPTAVSLAHLIRCADEHELPSRLVQGTTENDNWSVTHGPLQSQDLPDQARDWTLLVQEMDKGDSQVAVVLDHFRFLPHWILDDVMISQAAPGGSVGPHKDAYDVFLIQAEGYRRWELSQRSRFESDERFELALIADWTPELTVETAPGDVLYLPPGVGHHGVALTDCQTWSVGLRTPSGPEILFQLAESLNEQQGTKRRLAVTGIDLNDPDRIDSALIQQTRELLEQSLQLDDETLGDLLSSFLTRWRLWPNESFIELETVTRQLRAGHPVRLAATARLALLHGDRLYVNGERIDCPSELALALSRDRSLSADWLKHEDALDQLLELAAVEAFSGPSVVR